MSGEDDEVARLQQALAESQQEHARDKEDFETKMQDIRQKTKEHMTKFQQKTQAVIQQKDSQLKELEGAKDDALAEVTLLKESQSGGISEVSPLESARADAAEAKVHSLEKELVTLRTRLRTQEENAAKALPENGEGDEQLRTCRLELQEARSLRDTSEIEAQTLKAQVAELQEEAARSKQETQKKIGEVVVKAKEHVKSVQTRLEAQVSENKHLQTRFDAKETEAKDLTEKFREVDDTYAQQQEKLSKYKQLMAQANARIEDGDESTKEVRDSFIKLQAEHERLKKVQNSSEQACVPPSSAEIKHTGGILLTVEAENEELWCLLADGSSSAMPADQTPTSSSKRRWWLSSQLEVDDALPIPLQRRWKGEVAALRAQTARAKKRGEDVQEEFEAYKQKANAALLTGAAQSQDSLGRERKFEQLGQQLQAAAMEKQQVQAEKAKIFEDLGEVRRRLQEAAAQKSELEHTLDHRFRETQQAQESAVADCQRSFDTERESLAQKWREKERGYLQELDLRRAQKELLDEEIEGLRARLASQRSSAAAAAERAAAAAAAESDSEEGPGLRVPSSLPSRDGDMGVPLVASTPPHGHGLERLGGSPLDDGMWRGARSSPGSSTRPSPRAGGPSLAGAHASLSSSATPDAQPGPTPLLSTPRSGAEDGSASQSLAPQAYSLHASVAWQDLVSLRAQVRQLEATLQEHKQQHYSLEKEKEALVIERREDEEQQRLHNVVGQHQQMEYIRNVFKKFVENLPAGQAEHEQLIPVLMAFFQFGPEDTRAIQVKRQQGKSQGLWNSLSTWRG